MSDESRDHFVVSPPVLYALLAAAGLGGAGGYGVVGPQLETKAIEACFDNSKTAIEVASQHGQEILDLRRLLNNKTMYRYTSEDASSDRLKQERRDEGQDRRLRTVERHIDSRDD